MKVDLQQVALMVALASAAAYAAGIATTLQGALLCGFGFWLFGVALLRLSLPVAAWWDRRNDS